MEKQPQEESNPVKPVAILKAINPQELGDGRLVSPNIDGFVDKHADSENLRWERLANLEEGSLEEAAVINGLANLYLLKTSQKLSSPDPSKRSPNREFWAARFTEASSEIYAPPEISFIELIVEEEIEEFDGVEGEYIDSVRDFYQKLQQGLERIDQDSASNTERMRQIKPEDLRVIADWFYRTNKDWFEHLEVNRQDTYTPEDMVKLFNDLLEIRSQTDSRWSDWKSVIRKNGSAVSISGSSKKLFVGENRASASHKEILGLVAHELGIHAQRSINGSEISDEMATGLRGYLNTEESLGVFAERLVNGETPAKARDRYLDIALGLGMIPGIELSRSELIEISTNRAMARKELYGQDTSKEAVKVETHKAQDHVNRIFRGGDGLNGESNAIFTKDAVYYPAAIEGFIARQIEEGYDPESVFIFLTQGKFDPTNQSHIDYIKKHGGKHKPSA